MSLPGARASLMGMEAARNRYLIPQALWFSGPLEHDLWREYVRDGCTGRSLERGRRGMTG